MGHRSYLNMKTDEEEISLFEANNSLPFFWIALLDEGILKAHQGAWQYYEKVLLSRNEDEIESYTDICPHPTSLLIDQTDFDRNTSRSERFLSTYFPASLPLFRDFRTYLRSHFAEADDCIVIDILAVAHFTSVGELWESLFREIQAIENDQPELIQFFLADDLIASGTGFSTRGFEQFSAAYREAFKNRLYQPVIKQSSPKRFHPGSFWLFTVLLLICPVFTYVTYRGYLKEGLSGTVVLVGLCNIGFYGFSVWGIREEIRAFWRQTSP